MVVYILMMAWGWVLLIVGAVILLALRRLGAGRFPIAVALLILALIWQQAATPYNFGRNSGASLSPDGTASAHVERKGMWTYALVISRNGKDQRFHLPSGDSAEAPARIFWISPSLIGVDYPTKEDLVIDLTPDLDMEHWRRPPSASETPLFKVPPTAQTQTATPAP
mgnify:CR=1 FL=1